MAPFQLVVQRQSVPMEGPMGPPPGAVDESRAPEIVAGNAVCQVVGTLFFLARVYSRLIITNSWKSEDTVLVGAWIFASAYSICQYGQVEHGSGHHLGVILQGDPEDAVESQKYAFAASLVLLFALGLPKLSICLTYLRIFHSDQRGRRLIQGVILLALVPIFPFFLTFIFQCKPINVYWTEGRPASKCFTDISGLYVNGGLNILVDIALMAIVLPRVLELHLNARQKWALVGIVCLGSFAVVAGVIRIVRVGVTLSKPNFDASWDMYDISIWTSTEVYVSLICAAAPGVKPLVSKILPKLLGTTLSSRSRTKATVAGGRSIELSSNMRRKTIGSTRVRRNTHDSVLEEAEGPYTEVGSGIDRESFERKSIDEDSGAQRGIYKTSEITIRTSVMR